MRLDSIKEIKRLVIYFFYDADGIVDRYVPYMLEDIKRNCSEIFVVCNGKLTPEGRETFKKLTPNVMVRENTGFDVWAYKTALEHYGWDKLAEYDEVVMMNFTIFGPLYPFSEMFEEMNRRDVDFWGITKHHKVDFDVFNTCKYKYIPEHIQSSFIAIRRPLASSLEYQKMWKEMPMIHSYAESVGYYEAIFTKDFTDKGFMSSVYIDASDLEGYTRYPLMMMSDELIKNRKCPIIKVKSFYQDYADILGDTIGNCTIDALDYIKLTHCYDIDMIWEHVLRVANMADIKRIMHLNFILPQNYRLKSFRTEPNRICLALHLYYPELVEECLRYAASMPINSQLIVTVTNEKMRDIVSERLKGNRHFSKIRIELIENRGRDVSALLVGVAPFVNEYDLICFMHDKKTKQTKPYCSGRSFAYLCFENNLASKEYVSNVISTFEENPRLGMLMPPTPHHSMLYNTLGCEWYSNFENTVALADKIGIHCDISADKEPIAPLGTMFWFRAASMQKLFNYGWKYEDFPREPNQYDGTLLHAIERIYGYVVQDEGYYPAWVMTDRFARIETTNLSYSLRRANITLLTCGGVKISPRRKEIKSKIKRIVPSPIWRAIRKIYRALGGKKWVG